MRDVLRLALGPTKHASNVWNWWPVIVALVSPAMALVGLSGSHRLHLDRPWWLFAAALILALLFARAAYVLRVGAANAFPDLFVQVNHIEQSRHGDGDGSLAIGVIVLLVNREATRPVSLTLELTVVGDEEQHLLRVGAWPKYFERPLDLQAGKSDRAIVGPFKVSSEALPALPTHIHPEMPAGQLLLDYSALRVRVMDLVSGKSVSFTIPGSYGELA